MQRWNAARPARSLQARLLSPPPGSRMRRDPGSISQGNSSSLIARDGDAGDDIRAHRLQRALNVFRHSGNEGNTSEPASTKTILAAAGSIQRKSQLSMLRKCPRSIRQAQLLWDRHDHHKVICSRFSPAASSDLTFASSRFGDLTVNSQASHSFADPRLWRVPRARLAIDQLGAALAAEPIATIWASVWPADTASPTPFPINARASGEA